jgi:hypothetical protein
MPHKRVFQSPPEARGQAAATTAREVLSERRSRMWGLSSPAGSGLLSS